MLKWGPTDMRDPLPLYRYYLEKCTLSSVFFAIMYTIFAPNNR